MKALMYRGKSSIHFQNIPDVKLTDKWSVIVKTTMCSICGSDLHPYHHDTPVKNGCIGHEAVGEVIEIGVGYSKRL
jgi:threonine dehydrogenase-like Zn-dependent dehydrogenase